MRIATVRLVVSSPALRSDRYHDEKLLSRVRRDDNAGAELVTFA
jgi:hypothetical protein